MLQVRHLLVEPRRRFRVEIGNRRDRMHQISHIDDEGKVAGVQVPHDMAHASVGEGIDLEGRVAVVLALIEVRVGNDTERKQPPAKIFAHAFLPFRRTR